MTIVQKDTLINQDAVVVREEYTHANRDPITDEPGAHVVGTGLGAAAGGIAGAMAGAAASAATGVATGTLLGGPIGGAIGLVAGAVVGGLLGSAAGEALNPTEEDRYWSTAYVNEPYYSNSFAYSDYQPAYRTGYEGYSQYPGRSFDDVEGQLQEDYIQNRGNSRLAWLEARAATRSAWERRHMRSDA